MLEISDEVKASLDRAIKHIKNEIPACEVIRTNSWQLPVFKQRVTYTVIKDREMTILEEFIMKAAKLEVTEEMNIALIAHLLQMDEIFIKSCIIELGRMAIVENDLLPIVKLTKSGLEHLERGMIPDKAFPQEIEFYVDRKFGVFYSKIIQDNSYEVNEAFELLNDSLAEIKKEINRSFIINMGKEQGKVIENLRLGQYISSIKSLETIEKSQTLISEIWVRSSDTEEELCKIWDHAKEVFRPEIAELI